MWEDYSENNRIERKRKDKDVGRAQSVVGCIINKRLEMESENGEILTIES